MAPESNVLRIPPRFYWDHVERDLPAPELIRERKDQLWITRDDPHLPELISDALFYVDMAGDYDGPPGIVHGARALLRALRRQGVEWTIPPGLSFTVSIIQPDEPGRHPGETGNPVAGSHTTPHDEEEPMAKKAKAPKKAPTKKKATPAKKPEPGSLFRLGIVTTPEGRIAWEPVRKSDGGLSPSLAKLYPDHSVEGVYEVRAGSFREAREALEAGDAKAAWSKAQAEAGKRKEAARAEVIEHRKAAASDAPKKGKSKGRKKGKAKSKK